MSRLLPKSAEGRTLAIMGLVGGAVFLMIFLIDAVLAAPYSNPFWSNNSPSQESALCDVQKLAMTCESQRCSVHCCGEKCCDVTVDVRTGELFWDKTLFRTPGVLEDNAFSIRWRSMISGASQLGRQTLPSWETTVEYVVLNEEDPSGPNGHMGRVRRPSGRIDDYTWDGASYEGPADVRDTLTKNVAGNYVLTDKWGNQMTFDGDGMPAEGKDRNGNTDTYTYDASYRMTGYTDDRGKTYIIAHNANNYISSITDPAGRTWTFTYDSSDNLKTVKTPATTDQPSGITTTLDYDASNRLASVTDGRGNTVWQFGYFGATNQIATVTINGSSVGYSYSSGMTMRTDRNGNVYRYYFTGNQITKTDMLVDQQPKYVTLYRYGSPTIANIVYPRGNRVDYTWDSMFNLTQRRHRTQDTGTDDPSDLVHSWTYNTGNFVISYTDPRANTWTYSRDAAGNLTGVINPMVTNPATQTSSKSYTYNAKGQITKFTDEEGTDTDYTYFASGSSNDLLQKIEVDPIGLDLETSFTYDAAGNVATKTDPRGKAWSYTWDTVRRLTEDQAPSPLGYRRKYNYDGNGNLTKKEVENIDKNGNPVGANPWFTTTLTYTNTDDLLTLVEEIDASTTRTTTFDYDFNQNRIRVTKPEGNKEKWEYNERDWVVKHIRGETDPKASEVEYSYDENGNRTTFTDGRDNDTTYTFDLFDRRMKETNALNHYTAWEYDKNGNVTKVRKKDSSDTELQRESYFLDERNRPWKTSALFKDLSQTYSDAVTTIERLKTGQVKKVTNPRGKDTTYTYDAAGRQTKITDAMGNEWSYTLDANGNRTAWSIKEKDGGSNVIHDYEATYDELNRRQTYVEIDRTDANNKYTTQFFYGSRSNLVFRINAEGNPVRWTFDGLRRMVKHERALTVGATIDDFTSAQVTEWGFDKNDRVTSHKDDSPNESTWAYDALDRATTMTYPDSKTVSYVYDANDNVTKTTDPAGNVIDDTFDALNRNTSRSIALVPSFLGTTSETRTFDAVNRMLTNEDNDYKLELEYAVIGLESYVYKETQRYVGMTAYPKSVTKTYDANGNKGSEAYPSGANLTVSYGYNDIDRLTSMSDGTNTIASYAYIGLRKKKTTYQNNATRTNTYTGFRGELGSVHHQTSSPATIVRLDYAYDKVHDRLYERYGASGSSGDAFAYDKLRRLTNAWMGSSNPASPVGNSYTKKIDYNYDDDGNRTSVVVTPWQQSPTTTSYTTNNLNEYTDVGGTTHVWDANGNLTDNGTFIFKYDYKNLIVQVKKKSDGSTVASYRYDALGRRVEKNTGDAERYIRSTALEPGDQENISHVVAVYDGSNNWQQNFVWNDEIDGIQMLEQADVLDYDTDGNTAELTRSFYHRNALGSVTEITDLNQATAVSYRYDPYGKVTITRGGTPQTSDPLGQHWTFTARFLDEESDLLYYRARYYDPDVGRFVQRDPLSYSVGPNLFSYVQNNPINWRDPSGRQRLLGQDRFEQQMFQVFLWMLILRMMCDCGDMALEIEWEIKVHVANPLPGPLGWAKPTVEVRAASVAAHAAADSHVHDTINSSIGDFSSFAASLGVDIGELHLDGSGDSGKSVTYFFDDCDPPITECSDGELDFEGTMSGWLVVAVVTIKYKIHLEWHLYDETGCVMPEQR
jgi:RHS repeat-associated protein